jgi:hypothetical protein
MHLSDLTRDEAVELGSTVAAPHRTAPLSRGSARSVGSELSSGPTGRRSGLHPRPREKLERRENGNVGSI